MRARGRGGPSRYLYRLAPLGTFAGLGALTLVDGPGPLTVLFGIGALYSGRRLLDKRGNARKELLRRVRDNVRELGASETERQIAAAEVDIKRLDAERELEMMEIQMGLRPAASLENGESPDGPDEVPTLEKRRAERGGPGEGK